MVCDKAFVYQCFCAISASVAVLVTGTAIGWTSPTLKKLVYENPVFTQDQGSWIGAMHEPGHILAAVPAGILVSKWGPLNCLRLVGVFAVIGWILILTKISFWVICTARIFFGLSMGVAFTVVPLYVGEIASPEVRGVLGVAFQSMLHLGHLIEFVLGPWLSYFELATVSLCIPLAFLIATYFMVESPYFLLKEGKYDNAGKAYSKLSGETNLQEIELQLHRMQDMLDQLTHSRGTIKDIFLSGQHRDALLVVLVLAVAQRFSGMSAVVAYASSTFPSTTGGLNSSQYTILFGVTVLIFTIISGIFIDSRGRRPLTLISCAGCCIAEAVVSFYYYYYENKTNALSLLPVVVISCYACFYSIGLGPVINVLQSELFAPSVKGVSSSIVTVIHGISSFIVTKLYPFIKKSAGVYVDFSIFSIACLVAFIFSYFYLPETKRKSLQEVQEDCNRNR
ncbi:facilitated trehalose transporter Tret1-like isoform X2 [Lycorma delicatula]|uniref:facilitated trehalose transporter Tret1-like isoform X2 n=1 Tax=Lycorma delicatula TaxID=130591 RepID=UPI003F5157E7